MSNVLLVIHLLVALALIGVILLQKSEGGALGIGGGGSGGAGGMGGLMSGRSTANLLTRTTAILAACFIGLSLLHTIVADNGSRTSSITDGLVVPSVEDVLPEDAPLSPPVSE
ncbi:preprotein translocase subunit SecG [Kiloniella sp. b19]|uniref:preprotein translocase subunit SecG n=1 Tax=Kiloniella sp. GXU_MW_B19 TaxID=3141326 RepID=UPI0031DB9B09